MTSGRKKKDVNYSSIFTERLSKLFEKTGTTQAVLANATRVTRQTVAQWVSGKTVPDCVKLSLIADYFNVSADYLVGRTTSCSIESNSIDMKTLTTEIHENAKSHGWWDEGRGFGELIALCHSELSEALEVYRNGKEFTETYYLEDGKPEGIPVELADVIIRILDMCGRYGIDISEAIAEKHEYNKKRPYKHGGKVI